MTPAPPPDPVDRIMAVMRVAFDPQYREAWSARQVSDALILGNCHYRIVAADGRDDNPFAPPAGFYLSRQTIDEEELLLIAVDPQHRRCGLGRTLLDALLCDATNRGSARIFLEMRRGNPAEALYRAAGFVPVGVRPGYYTTAVGTKLDAITMALSLNKS